MDSQSVVPIQSYIPSVVFPGELGRCVRFDQLTYFGAVMIPLGYIKEVAVLFNPVPSCGEQE